jgi:hypothetical protein
MPIYLMRKLDIIYNSVLKLNPESVSRSRTKKPAWRPMMKQVSYTLTEPVVKIVLRVQGESLEAGGDCLIDRFAAFLRKSDIRAFGCSIFRNEIFQTCIRPADIDKVEAWLRAEKAEKAAS